MLATNRGQKLRRVHIPISGDLHPVLPECGSQEWIQVAPPSFLMGAGGEGGEGEGAQISPK